MQKARKILSLAAAAALLASVSVMGGWSAPRTATVKKAKPYIAVVAKGFQFQYWQVVRQGAEKAAKELGVTISFNGPASESQVQQQVDMINQALAKKPVALCLAALDTKSVVSQLRQAKKNKIPVIGFDSGVPNAPKGTVAATASTDNKKAAALAADKMFANAKFLAKLKKATTSKPVVIGVLSQDATSESVVGRTVGFLNEMKKDIQGLKGFSGAVEITGHVKYNKKSSKAAKVNIQVNVPPTTSATDLQNAAKSLLSTDNAIAIYGSNEGAADGILAASTDGSDFAKGGKYGAITAVGFDAGKVQKTAVKKGWFIGSITQDPYTIGYDCVKLAYKAYKKKAVSNVDTGAHWYNSKNMNNSTIGKLLYD